MYVATIGTFLNAINLTIKDSELRGVLSQGMICSFAELGMEDTSDGIAVVNEDIASKFNLGTQASLLLDLDDYIYV